MDEVQVEAKPGTYPNLDDIVVEDDGPPLLLPCIVCNKTFKPEALQRHSRICEKSASKKRKTFDSFKQRVQGTDLAEFLPFSTLQRRLSEKPPSPKTAVSHWKEKHEAFVSAIRAARGDNEIDHRGSGEPRSLRRVPDHDRCPYCERQFGPKAFDRHQEWCRDQHTRQPPSQASLQAKERLEARIKYRAPPIRSKRALTREKYSPLVQRKTRQVSPSGNSTGSCSNATSLSSPGSTSAGSTRQGTQTKAQQQEVSNRLSKSGSSLSGRTQAKENTAPAFNRGMAGRTSLRASLRASQRSVSPNKRLSGSGKSLSGSIQSVPEPTRQEKTRSKDFSVDKNTKQQEELPKSSFIQEPKNINKEEVKENLKNIKSTSNDKIWSGNRPAEPYDPYASAERQMMELLHSDSAIGLNNNGNLSGKNLKNQSPQPPSPAPSISPVPFASLSPKPSPLETSPTSAFTCYSKDTEPVQRDPQIEVQNSKAQINVEAELSESPLQPQSQPVANINVPAAGVVAPEPFKPQPPPRSFKRSASLQNAKDKELSDVRVVGKAAARPQLKPFHSVDIVLETNNNTFTDILDNRPRTYDIDNRNWTDKNMSVEKSWVGFEEDENMDVPVIRETSEGVKSELLVLDGSDSRKQRNETRESREVREIAEQDEEVVTIDGLLEEIANMQSSVSMLSELEPLHNNQNWQPQSSARRRRNRTGKMHIEDYLFPAEVLQRENINVGNSGQGQEQSGSVFGSTKSRRTSSRGRRLIEDMCFPPSDNDDVDEDGDVVVSANALLETFTTPGYGRKAPTCSSPVALTSKVVVDVNDDGLPRPKPLSLSTHSPGLKARSGLHETEPASASVSSSPTPTPPLGLGPVQPSPAGRKSASSRLSADSAYSSLNRRSPVPHARRHITGAGEAGAGLREAQQQHIHGAESPQSVISQSFNQSVILSSSGSESSLPPLSVSQTSRCGGQGGSKQGLDTPTSEIGSATTPLPKLSKFCHECGTRFPVTVAKFCHECGTRRFEL